MRPTGVRRILYASGSGVYGDLGELEAAEDHGPLVPVSTYGASKLAGEALISAYAPHVRSRGSRLPVRQRRRAAARPTASASTSCAGCAHDPTRLTRPRRRQPEQVVHPRRRCRARGADRATTPTSTRRSPPTTWPPATTSLCARSSGLALEVWVWRPTTSRSSTAMRPADGRGTCPLYGSAQIGSGLLAGVRARGSAGALRASMHAMLNDLAVGRG